MQHHITSIEAESVRFAFKVGAFSKKGIDAVSHYSTDGYCGGIMQLPEIHAQEFLTLYVRDVFLFGRRLYLSEQRSVIFAMHFDLDGILLNAEQRLALLRLIQEILNCFYPKTTDKKIFEMFICDTSKADQLEPQFAKPKTNLHPVCPYLNVDALRAEQIARACASKANVVLPEFNWDEVFDLLIYQQNGLRMLGSRKCEKCKKCYQKKDLIGEPCFECNGHARIDLGRAYDLVAVLNSDGEYDDEILQKCKENQFLKMQLCSIRRGIQEIATPNYTKYIGCPNADVEQKLLIESKKRKLIENKNLTQSQLFDEIMELEKPENFAQPQQKKGIFKLVIDRFAPQYNCILHEINTFAQAYATTQILELTTTLTRNIYRATTKGDGCHSCQNLPKSFNNGEHHGKTIYFIIKKTGIQQKCWSKKAEGRINGNCAEFSSVLKKLSQNTLLALYPNSVMPTHSGDPLKKLYRMKFRIERRLADGPPEEQKSSKEKKPKKKPFYSLY